MRLSHCLVLVGLAACATGAAAFQEQPGEQPKVVPHLQPQVQPEAQPIDRLSALLEAHEASDLGYAESYNAFRPQFEAFAKAHRGSEDEARAMLWLIQQCWWLRSEGTMETTAMPIAEDLLARHADSQHLALLIEYKYVFKKDQRQALFERVAETSPHDVVKAAAHFGLAQLSPARSDSGEPNAHYAKLVGQYADVQWRETTFGRIADAYLNPLTPSDLAVGKVVPEIEGINEHGEPMKLSDYRGRVVLIDFWGDW